MTTQQTLVFGIHSVIELLKNKRRPVRMIYTTKPTPQAFKQIQPLIPAHVTIQYVPRQVLTSMADSSDHQGVVAVTIPFPFRKKTFDSKRAPFLVLLDGIQDPRNVGAIIRSAYCTNVSGVILCKKNCAPLTAVAHKASAGLVERMEIYEAPSAVAAITELRSAGYQFYLATLEGVDARTVSYQDPLCLVIGSEGTGISPQIRSAGIQILIPQKTADVSYNASVAAAILMFTMSSSLHKI